MHSSGRESRGHVADAPVMKAANSFLSDSQKKGTRMTQTWLMCMQT